jgi:hypothetical protein
MLQYVELSNFRCFVRHRLPLREQTIVVGRNNAGKSTVIEGFRFIGLITERYQHLNFHPVPEWLEIPRTHRGIRPALEGFDISLEKIFHRYGDPQRRLRRNSRPAKRSQPISVREATPIQFFLTGPVELSQRWERPGTS